MDDKYKKNFFQTVNMSQLPENILNNIHDSSLLISAVEANLKISYDQFIQIAKNDLKLPTDENNYVKAILDYIGNNYSKDQLEEIFNIFVKREDINRVEKKENTVQFDSTFMKFLIDYVDNLPEKENAISRLYNDTNLNEYLFNTPLEFRTSLFLNDENISYSLVDTDTILKKFNNKYGEEKYNQYKETLEFITNNFYNTKFNENISQLNNLINYSLNKYIDFFLNEEDIINLCDPKLVFNYILSDFKIKQDIYNSDIEKDVKQQRIANRINTDPINKKEFLDMIGNVYGQEATLFLEKRPGLCSLNNIHSLRLLDPIVLNSFKNEFIQDLFNYNFPSIDNFIKIIKEKDNLECFKEHYHILSTIFGENCETMEKAFGSFYRFNDLLINMKDKTVNDQNYNNLIGLYCSDNVINIKKVDELEDFPLLMEDYVQKSINDNNQLNCIYKLFHLDSNQVEMYLSDIEEDELRELDLIEMQTLTIIKKVLDDPKNNLSILFQEKNSFSEILYSVNSTIQKIKGIKLKKLENKVVNLEKILDAVNDDSKNTKLVNIEGMDVVFLGDLEGMTLSHTVNANSSYSNYSNFSPIINPANSYNTYEGYDGLSTISCQISPIENIGLSNNTTYYFWNIQNKDLVTVSNRDALVSHSPKLVNSTAESSVSIPNGIENLNSNYNQDNEIAFYRYIRNHNMDYGTNDENRRVIPDAASYRTIDDLKNIINSFGSNIILVCNGEGTKDEIMKITSNIKDAKKLIAQETITKEDDDYAYEEQNENIKSLGGVNYFLIVSIIMTIVLLVFIFIAIGGK